MNNRIIHFVYLVFCVNSICYPGTYVDTSTNKCVECPKHWYSTTRDATECIVCPNGYYQPSTGWSECIACPAGSYTFDRTVDASAVYELNPDYFGCHPCAAGTYSNSVGATSCIQCSQGYYSGPGAITCDECLPGYTPSDNKETCVPCDLGTFWSQNPIPFIAPEGQISFTSGCTACPNGSYQESQGMLYCDPCPAYHTTILIGAVSQSACITYQVDSPEVEFNFVDGSAITLSGQSVTNFVTIDTTTNRIKSFL